MGRGGGVTVYILFSECGRLVVVSLCLCQVKTNILLESSSVNLRNFNFIYKLIVKLSQRLKKIIKDLYNDYFYQKQRMLTFKKAVKLETCTYLLCMQVMIKYMQRIYNIYIYKDKNHFCKLLYFIQNRIERKIMSTFQYKTF